MISSPISGCLDNKIKLTGTTRARHPSETLAIIKPHLISIGITRVARVTGLDRVGLPTSVCIRPNSRHMATAQGKGATPELADISAIMEAIEGYCAENVASPNEYASFHDMQRNGVVLNPSALPPGPRWKAWSERMPLRWVRCRELEMDTAIWIPFASLSMDSTKGCPDFGIIDTSTTGLAAGNSFAEAVCHAIFEIVERMAETHWETLSASEREATILDQDTMLVPHIREMIDRITKADIAPIIYDITGKLGIPAYHCVLIDNQTSAESCGSGAHLEKEVALCRALMEAAQARLTWIHGAREDIFRGLYDSESAMTYACSSIRERTNASNKALDFRQRSSPFNGVTFKDDLDWLVNRLKSYGYSKLAVYEHELRDIDIAVVRVVLPDLSSIRS